LRAKKRSAKKKASCVASAGATVVVGTKKNGQVAVVGSAVDELHDPEKVKGAELLDVGVLLLVVKGRTPLPGGPVAEDEPLPLDCVVDEADELETVPVKLEDDPDRVVPMWLLELEGSVWLVLRVVLLAMELEDIPETLEIVPVELDE
jgi:hypothetical protein